MWHIFQAIRYLCRKVHREKRQEVWRIGKPAAPVGMVLCARSPLPLFSSSQTGQRPHKLCPTHSAKPRRIQASAKKRRNPQRIRGLKGLPVITSNGSNLARGVNELVSVLPAQFEPGDDHLAGRPLSTPQTGPSSESHQHSALFGRFFSVCSNFCLLLHVDAFLFH